MVKREFVLALFVAVGTAGCAAPHSGNIAESGTSSTTITPTMILMEQPVHFTAPDGGHVVVEPTDYRVEQTMESHLRLVPENGGQPLLLAAVLTTHDIEVSKPFPLLLALNDDARNLILLFPDGTAIDAAGSLSGIKTRDIAQPRRRYHLAYQLDQATGQVQFGDGVVGKRLPGGQSQVASNYRVGAGSMGNIGATAQSSELAMIDLQSMVSQRQLAVSLAQNIAAAQNEPFHLEYNTNRPGSDYSQRTTVSPEACRAICSADGQCQAFTFVKPPRGASTGQCFLKQSVPTPVGNPCCISAKRKSAQQELIGNIGR